MKIAIIDSGIDPNHKRLKNARISGVNLSSNTSSCWEDQIGHGTACASIIYKHYPDAELLAVKIFDKDLFVNENVLIESLKWCIENEVDIINLSVGVNSHSPNERLYQLSQELYDQNKVLVASCSPDNKTTYPACYPNTIGVTSCWANSKSEFYFIHGSKVEFAANGNIQRVAWNNGGFKITAGSSYACAHMTGIISNQIASSNVDLSCKDLKKLLIDKSTKNGSLIYMEPPKQEKFILNVQEGKNGIEEIARSLFSHEEKYGAIKTLGVFPISEKELQPFTKFSDDCTIKDRRHYDYPKSISKVDNDILALLEIDWEEVDGFVFGYFHENLFPGNVKYGYEILNTCLELKKRMYFYDYRLLSYIKQTNAASLSNIRIPLINEKLYNKVLAFRYLPQLRTPVISVVGTGSRQGKFTAQLVIKRILTDIGYKVSALSTEPCGEFFGASFTFHYGYMHNINIDRDNWGLFLRSLLKGIEYYENPDIIITGSQGATIPKTIYREPFGNETKTLDFINGVQPDATVCVVFPEDDIERINDVIGAARCFSRSKNLFILLYPFARDEQYNLESRRQLTHEEFTAKVEYLENQLGTRVFNIMDPGCHETMAQSIQQFFS